MTQYCIDTSAWHHASDAGVQQRWTDLLTADRLVLCDQVRLEILYSGRSADDYAALAAELDGLPKIPSGGETFTRGLQVQQMLSVVGGLHHRSVKIADLLIAAAAEASDAVVLHYDADYDRIATVTGQGVEWIAPRGSL